jgi:sugar O-acyltransferase (sialic acid O-acetyltransferase NeuD family)
MDTPLAGVILFGAGGHARVIADIARCSGRDVYALVVDSDSAQSSLDGVPVLNDIRQAADRHPGAYWCVCIGDNHSRATVVARLKGVLPDVQFLSLIHPSAAIARDVVIGEGTVVMAGTVVNPGTKIGQHCIVNTGACIDHDNVLEDFASIAPGVITGGNVSIGVGAAVGIGACARHGVSIGEHAVIGAGSVVLGDIPGSSVAFGTPCRVVRSRNPADPYL